VIRFAGPGLSQSSECATQFAGASAGLGGGRSICGPDELRGRSERVAARRCHGRRLVVLDRPDAWCAGGAGARGPTSPGQCQSQRIASTAADGLSGFHFETNARHPCQRTTRRRGEPFPLDIMAGEIRTGCSPADRRPLFNFTPIEFSGTYRAERNAKTFARYPCSTRPEGAAASRLPRDPGGGDVTAGTNGSDEGNAVVAHR